MSAVDIDIRYSHTWLTTPISLISDQLSKNIPMERTTARKNSQNKWSVGQEPWLTIEVQKVLKILLFSIAAARID